MIEGSILVDGTASGPLLVSDTGLSFWGGVDLSSGEIIDQHHPLFACNISGCILAIPNGRGSCSGSGALLELVLNDCAPAALIFSEAEDILTLGVLVADALFQGSIPVLRLSRNKFKELRRTTSATVHGNRLFLDRTKEAIPTDIPPPSATVDSTVSLTELDQQILELSLIHI